MYPSIFTIDHSSRRIILVLPGLISIAAMIIAVPLWGALPFEIVGTIVLFMPSAILLSLAWRPLSKSYAPSAGEVPYDEDSGR
jgi:membrane protein implicated in regulation of membrane protease activity